MWRSGPFWPFLTAENGAFCTFVLDSKVLPLMNVILKGLGNNGIFAENPLKFRLIALKLSF